MTAGDLPRASLEAVKAFDREAWLDLFDDDAVVEDPVGVSPLDPEGKGHRGREAIGRFYDAGIASLEAFDYELRWTCVCGDEVAALVKFTITPSGGQSMEMDAMNIYQLAPNGKMAALRSFHDGLRAD